MNPAQEETHVVLGQAYALAGMIPEAEAEYRMAVSLSSEHARATAALGTLAARQGRIDEARAVLDALHRRAAERYVSPVDFVALQISLGLVDDAFASLNRAWGERRGWMAYLRVEPALDPLRGDPRFAELLRRMHLD
jgi:Tfp pilus assembly protein PilF